MKKKKEKERTEANLHGGFGEADTLLSLKSIYWLQSQLAISSELVGQLERRRPLAASLDSPELKLQQLGLDLGAERESNRKVKTEDSVVSGSLRLAKSKTNRAEYVGLNDAVLFNSSFGRFSNRNG